MSIINDNNNEVKTFFIVAASLNLVRISPTLISSIGLSSNSVTINVPATKH